MNKPTAYGIDVSEHNGKLSFSAMSPVPDFVIIRAGYSKKEDKRANDYRLQLDNLGIPYGVYWYTYASTVEAAKLEAQFCLNLIKDWNVTVGVWYDMEYDTYKAGKHVTNNPTLITALCKAFCEEIEKAGYYTGIYASKSWFGSKIKGLDQYDKWVAWWGTPNDGVRRTDSSSMGTMQQYSSTNGKMDKDCTYVPLSHYNVHPLFISKSLDEYAVEVWEGKYGSGSKRKKQLVNTKYGYNAIQKRVTQLGKVANEVIAGKYGNGKDRVDSLTNAGYNPKFIQRIVNAKLS